MSEKLDTDHIVDQMDTVNDKVNSLRAQIKNDPDDFIDKLVKIALPTVAGLIIGKLSEKLWKKGKRSILGDKALDEDGNDVADGIFASMLFAGLSASISSLTNNLSHKGSEKLVEVRHMRAAKKNAKHKN